LNVLLLLIGSVRRGRPIEKAHRAAGYPKKDDGDAIRLRLSYRSGNLAAPAGAKGTARVVYRMGAARVKASRKWFAASNLTTPAAGLLD
jgi:hypothetical protein